MCGNTCWLHLALNYNLRINPSQLPIDGLGVMQVNIHFNVDKILLNTLDEKQPSNGNDYVFQINRNAIINAASSGNIASFINDCRGAN